MIKKKVAFIVGPTACGKTSASIEVAKQLNAEIISADSIQVYKGLNIGSAKPTQDEMQGVSHHLLDCIDINADKFSVAAFKEAADLVIDDITKRGKLPLVVGGTGLYVNSLTFPLEFTGVTADENIRAELKEIEQKSPGRLHEMLTEIDKITAERLHKNDTKRIIRAIEVYKISGVPLSSHGNDFKNDSGAECDYDMCMIGLNMDRAKLYERINLRVDKMIEDGLLDEVKSIMTLPEYNRDLPALQGIGYKQLISHFEDNVPETIEETVELIKMETRRFAKRQLTWFRRDKRIHWIMTDELENTTVSDEIINIIRRELLQ